jgi:hypothetical protein
MKKKIVDLNEYTWGFGIEHEMHIFHKPILSNDDFNSKHYSKKIKDFIVFDSKSVVDRILEDKENSKSILSHDDYIFLKNIPFEISGRRCNYKWVIHSVPVKMPEFITEYPFCSIKSNRNIINMIKDIIFNKNRFINLLMNDPETKHLVDKYGELSEYPTGMTRYLKCPLEVKNNKYIFDKNNLLTEYNGSYHLTFTLPYNHKTTNKDFIKMHQNFCNQLQWLEPLMLAAYFTGDEFAPGSYKKNVRGSFRVMMIGWGNFAGSDIRLFNKGIGRYAKTPTYWRHNLSFQNLYKLKPCYKPSPPALKENAYSSLSSDFRTFGSTDPLRPMYRESGIKMTKPNGVEFRIFDHFPDKYLKHLVFFISLIAENSRITKTSGYVYENKIWIHEIHNIMKNGYKSYISHDYINLLRKKLNIPIETKSIIANDIFKNIFDDLWNKNIDGDWMKIFNCFDKPDINDIVFPNINKKAWQFSFRIMANNNKIILNNFNKLSKYINQNIEINFKDFKKIIIFIFGNNWKYDSDDLAYFYESLGFIKLTKNENYIITSLKKIVEIPKYNNFNDGIVFNFTKDFLFENNNNL